MTRKRVFTEREVKAFLGPISDAFRWIGVHPTTLLVSLVVYASSIGYIYEMELYRQFGINVAIYARYDDFLFGWVRNGAVVTYAFCGAVYAIFAVLTYFTWVKALSGLTTGAVDKWSRYSALKLVSEEYRHGTCVAILVVLFLVLGKSLVANIAYSFESINAVGLSVSAVFGTLPAIYAVSSVTHNQKHLGSDRWAALSMLISPIIIYVCILAAYVEVSAKFAAQSIMSSGGSRQSVTYKISDSSLRINNIEVVGRMGGQYFVYLSELGEMAIINESDLVSVDVEAGKPN